jgi:hypothetical protein
MAISDQGVADGIDVIDETKQIDHGEVAGLAARQRRLPSRRLRKVGAAVALQQADEDLGQDDCRPGRDVGLCP